MMKHALGQKAKWRHQPKQKAKATKTLSIVMGVFVLCWLPFFVLTITDPFINFTTPEDLYNVFLWLGYFNSAFNPIIYGMFYPWFRKACWGQLPRNDLLHPDSSNLSIFPCMCLGNALHFLQFFPTRETGCSFSLEVREWID